MTVTVEAESEEAAQEIATRARADGRDVGAIFGDPSGRYHGRVDIGDPRLPERFWRKVRVNDETGCWEWISPLRSDGYGVFGLKIGGVQRTLRAHRLTYEAVNGPIPEGLECDHLCRVRRCCNPVHIEAVTRKVNLNRGDVAETQRRRHAAVTHCPQGHEYTPSNTLLWQKDGVLSRRCRTCERERGERRRRVVGMAIGDPATANRAKTHCPKGHPYSGENLYRSIDAKGKIRRHCRACRRTASS